MADRRRRRKATASGDSDNISESSEEEIVEEKVAELESSAEVAPEKAAGDSEYESADEEDEGGESVHVEDENLEGENPADEEGGQEEIADVLEDDDIEGAAEWKDEQREEGDGEESEIDHAKEKSLDFDEDRRNPQYIPKKGGFYEHDDRLSEVPATEEPEKKVEETEKKKPPKKLWKDEGKWIHDRYHETEQNPKSINELVNVYGYDIRNEEGPPHARRRRRYGRGPSKYTRKWEDEAAYNSGTPTKGKEGESFRRGSYRGRRGSRGGGGGERTRDSEGDMKFDADEFPRLDSKTHDDSTVENVNDVSADSGSVNDDEVNKQHVEEKRETTRNFEDYNRTKRSLPRDAARSQRRPIRGRNRFGRGSPGKQPAFGSGSRERAKGSHDRPMADVTEDMKNLNCNDENDASADSGFHRKDRRNDRNSGNQHVINTTTYERRQASIPPRLQDAAANKPKRYSSQRQRTAPENGGNFQANASQSNSMSPRFYDQCYQQSVYSDRSSSSRNQSGNTNIMNQPAYQGYEQPYQESYGIRPITSSQRIFSPVSLAGGQPVIPPPYVASGGNLIGYGPPPAAYPQYPYPPSYPATVTPAVGDPHDNTLSAMHTSPPQEIFRGGMAYYNTQPPVRTVPKRPRAAIPIVPPPDMEGNGKDMGDSLTDEVECSENFENGNEEVDIEATN
ncbi:hypothetical protein CHUAL_002432 [Chamberlinius hualienensis]